MKSQSAKTKAWFMRRFLSAALAMLYIIGLPGGCAGPVTDPVSVPVPASMEALPDKTDEGEDPGTFTAITLSDLHFTLKGDGAIYPMTAMTTELAETIANEVIAYHPDAFIMTGDNTNSGFENDEEALSRILRRIHDEGIEVILTPGNHDMYRSTSALYRTMFEGLCHKEEEDPSSLSYSLTVKGIRILAMDDSSYTEGSHGEFCPDTFQWLEKQLEKAQEEEKTVLFLSHYNVLPGGEDALASSYMIHNAALRDTLIAAGVRLCFSGHRHTQEVLQYDAMYEVVSGMPASSPHLMGFLTIRDGEVDYHAEPVDFDTYGSTEEIRKLAAEEKNSPGNYRTLIETYADKETPTEEELQAMTEVFRTFMSTYASGTLALHQEEILAMPYCGPLIEILKNSNYGLWMERLLHTFMLPGNELRFRLF